MMTMVEILCWGIKNEGWMHWTHWRRGSGMESAGQHRCVSYIREKDECPSKQRSCRSKPAMGNNLLVLIARNSGGRMERCLRWSKIHVMIRYFWEAVKSPVCPPQQEPHRGDGDPIGMVSLSGDEGAKFCGSTNDWRYPQFLAIRRPNLSPPSSPATCVHQIANFIKSRIIFTSIHLRNCWWFCIESVYKHVPGCFSQSWANLWYRYVRYST